MVLIRIYIQISLINILLIFISYMYVVDMRRIESSFERTGRTLDLNYCQGNQLIEEVYLSNKHYASIL